MISQVIDVIFFIKFNLETLQLLGHIASRVFGCIPEGCVFHLLNSLILNEFDD